MKKLVVAGFSLLAVGLLVLGSMSNVVAFQTIIAKTHQKTLALQSIVKRLSQKQGIIGGFYGLIAVLVFIWFFFASLYIGVVPKTVTFLELLKISLLIALFWPLIIIIIFILLAILIASLPHGPGELHFLKLLLPHINRTFNMRP